MELIYLIEEFLLNLIFVKNQTEFSIRRITILLTKLIFNRKKIWFFHFTSTTDTVMLRIHRLHKESRTLMLEKGFIEEVKIFLARIKIRHIQANIRIQNHEQIQVPIFHRRRQKWSTNQNWIFSILSKAMQFIFKFLNFIWRSNRFWLNNQTFCSKLLFQDLCKFLCPHTVFSDFFASTLLALLREKILLFADMTNPNFLATRQKMIIHRNWTAITLRNMTTFMANYPCMIAFFVDEDSDFFLFSEVFSHPLFKKFRKSLVDFFGHIYQIDFLMSMIKKFVVHR